MKSLTITIYTYLLLYCTCSAHAATWIGTAFVNMPMTARIVDCRTYEKAKTLCTTENICCERAAELRIEEEKED